MPSFQVTTVGRGVSTSTEDEQPESQAPTMLQPALSNDVVPDETKPQLAMEAGQVLDITSHIKHPTPHVS